MWVGFVWSRYQSRLASFRLSFCDRISGLSEDARKTLSVCPWISALPSPKNTQKNAHWEEHKSIVYTNVITVAPPLAFPRATSQLRAFPDRECLVTSCPEWRDIECIVGRSRFRLEYYLLLLSFCTRQCTPIKSIYSDNKTVGLNIYYCPLWSSHVPTCLMNVFSLAKAGLTSSLTTLVMLSRSRCCVSGGMLSGIFSNAFM